MVNLYGKQASKTLLYYCQWRRLQLLVWFDKNDFYKGIQILINMIVLTFFTAVVLD